MRPYRYAKLSVRALLHMIDVCVKEECCVYRVFGHVDYVYLRIIGEEATAILVSSPSDGRASAFDGPWQRYMGPYTTTRVATAAAVHSRAVSVSHVP